MPHKKRVPHKQDSVSQAVIQKYQLEVLDLPRHAAISAIKHYKHCMSGQIGRYPETELKTGFVINTAGHLSLQTMMHKFDFVHIFANFFYNYIT